MQRTRSGARAADGGWPTARGGKLEARGLVERVRSGPWQCTEVVRHHGELSIDVARRSSARSRRSGGLTAEAKATVRFETAPGHPEIDFGEPDRGRAGVYLFVATLGYSRVVMSRRSGTSRQSSWFRGLEGTFRHFAA